MAKRKQQTGRPRDGVIGPALRPIAWSVLFGAVLAGAATGPVYAYQPLPAYAEPSAPNQAPDPGSRPQPSGLVQLPGGAAPVFPGTPGTPTTPITTNPQLGPLAFQITAAETEVASLGEQLKQLTIERQQAQTDLAALKTAWQKTLASLDTAKREAESAAESAYKHAAELPPGTIDSDLHGLGALSRLRQTEPTVPDAPASQLKRAEEAAKTAEMAYTAADSQLSSLSSRYTTLQATFRQREQALLKLRKDNSAQLAAIERAREAQEQQLGSGYAGGDTVAGKQAGPKARQAVRFALNQLGEPYVLNAEGPNTWDCSGLMWGAYRSVGIGLPRVARFQYQGTKTRRVNPNALLPGDLLFFSSSKTDATKIHHVGMYIGGGKMVHAPTTGDVVKISTVWWSRFYAATRVVDPVPATNTPTTPKPTPTTKPTPGPSKTPSATPSWPKPTTKPPTKPPTTPPTTTPTTPPVTPSPTPAPTRTAAPSAAVTQPSATGAAATSNATGAPAEG